MELLFVYTPNRNVFCPYSQIELLFVPRLLLLTTNAYLTKRVVGPQGNIANIFRAVMIILEHVLTGTSSKFVKSRPHVFLGGNKL